VFFAYPTGHQEARKANRKLAEYIRESALNGEVVSGHNAETIAIAKNLIGMANTQPTYQTVASERFKYSRNDFFGTKIENKS